MKFDANIFIAMKIFVWWSIYAWLFTTLPIWLRNDYSHQFWGGYFGGWPSKCSWILSRPPKGTSLAGNTRFGA